MLIKDEARRPVTNIVSLHSELIVLRDDSAEIGKSKHHLEHDQKPIAQKIATAARSEFLAAESQDHSADF
jgi:hypothetical protein